MKAWAASPEGRAFFCFVKFCFVGASGVVVDVAILHFLADPKWLGWNVSLAKVCAAEVAMLNNFAWNELWTFRAGRGQGKGMLRRLLVFNAICSLGILWAVLLLNLFYRVAGWNLYLSNLLAILLVTAWNFWLNARFNWRAIGAPRGAQELPEQSRPNQD